MDYKKEYGRYLASPEWKELRAKARERAGNKCEFCGGSPDHVHHVKYPKRYKDDHLDNLVVVCETCHSKLHGIKNDLMVDEWVGEAVSIRMDGSRVVVRMLFTPITECFRHPLPLLSEAKRYGDKWAQDITDQFGGDIFIVGKTYEKDLYLDNNVFYKSFKDITAEDFIFTLLEEKNNPVEDFSEIGEALFLALSIGPVLCACKNHE